MDPVKNRQSIIVAGAVITCVLLAYMSIAGYFITMLTRADADRHLLRGKLAEARHNLPQEDLLYAEKCLISKKEVSGAIEKITSQGKSMSIDFISITMGPPDKNVGCSILPIFVEARSTYKQFGIFLESLRKMKRYIVKVRSLRIVPDKDKPGIVRASMVLNQYVKAESDAR